MCYFIYIYIVIHAYIYIYRCISTTQTRVSSAQESSVWLGFTGREYDIPRVLTAPGAELTQNACGE